MIAPERYIYEDDRLKDLDSYSLKDAIGEDDYDNLTAIATQICGTRISLISIVDDETQWFLSARGLDLKETSREASFCAHAIHEPTKLFEVENTAKDPRFINNPFVIDHPHIAFYAGFPLVSNQGFPLGTICVLDDKPNKLNAEQSKAIKALAKQVVNLFELRKANKLLEKAAEDLESKNRELDRFASMAAHDIKAPLNNITSLSDLLKETYTDQLDEEGQSILTLISDSTNRLRLLVDGLLKYSRSNELVKSEKMPIEITAFAESLMTLVTSDDNCTLEIHNTTEQICANKIALEQIFINLFTNAIKYNDKEYPLIKLTVSASIDHYHFSICDNGPGIAIEGQAKVFEIFETMGEDDRYGQKGNGIGLATVKKLIETMGGKIDLSSEIGKGTCFNFFITK